MDECLRIAEVVYDKIHSRNGFQGDSVKDLNIFLMELKREIRDSNIKFKYEFNNMKELIEQIEKNNGRKIDLSLMPSRQLKDEFILWLAVVYSNITDKVISETVQKKTVAPPKPKPENNGESITAYLKSKESKTIK